MLLSGMNNIVTYSKWFCLRELYAMKRNMQITGMQLSGVDCTKKQCQKILKDWLIRTKVVMLKPTCLWMKKLTTLTIKT